MPGLRVLHLLIELCRSFADLLFLLVKLLGIGGQVNRVVPAEENVLPFLDLFLEIDLDDARLVDLADGRAKHRIIACRDHHKTAVRLKDNKKNTARTET